jgi:hypothetical protein
MFLEKWKHAAGGRLSRSLMAASGKRLLLQKHAAQPHTEQKDKPNKNIHQTRA